MTDFFEYTCDACGNRFCERIQIMNLVLDQIEEAYCLNCLSEQADLLPKEFYEWIMEYVEARECFKTPWDKFHYAPCPRITDKSCYCKV